MSLNPPEGPDNPFKLNGAQLLAAAVFDAEVALLECESQRFLNPSSVIKIFIFIYLVLFPTGKTLSCSWTNVPSSSRESSKPSSKIKRTNNGFILLELQTCHLKKIQPPVVICRSSLVLCLTRLAFTALNHTHDCSCLWFQFPFIVAVVVKNLNDNSPSFQQAVYKLSVNEVGKLIRHFRKDLFSLVSKCVFGIVTSPVFPAVSREHSSGPD